MISTDYISNDYDKKEYYDKMEKKAKGLQKMSYVGILKGYDGLVAFGDTKNTLVSVMGFREEGPPIQKVFKCKDFLVVAHNNMDYHKKGRIIPISDLIQSLSDKPFEEFIWCLVKELKDTAYRLNYTYCFHFGTSNQILQIFSLIISPKKICFETKESNAVWGGDYPYAPADIRFEADDMNMEQLKDLARDCFQMAVRYGDKYLQYNPVGGKLMIETLPKRKTKGQG